MRLKSFLALVLIISLCGCHFLWKKYTNKDLGFSINFPRSWRIEQRLEYSTVIAKAPLQSTSDPYQENITIMVVELPSELYADSNFRSHPVETYFEVNKEMIFESLPGEKSDISEGYIQSGRNKGKFVSFTNSLDTLNIKVVSALWIAQERAYNLSYTVETDELSKYESVFKEALSSFRILD